MYKISDNLAGGQNVAIKNNWKTMVIKTSKGKIRYRTISDNNDALTNVELYNLTLNYNPDAKQTEINDVGTTKLLFTEKEIILVHSLPLLNNPKTIIYTDNIELVLIDGGDRSRVITETVPCANKGCSNLLGGRKSRTRKNRSAKSRRV
jgi:hypothetical protein